MFTRAPVGLPDLATSPGYGSRVSDPIPRRTVAAPPPATAPAPTVLRFSDVMAELREAVRLSGDSEHGAALHEASVRLADLMQRLRRQFLEDLGLVVPDEGPRG
jgi:hypothetical protein